MHDPALGLGSLINLSTINKDWCELSLLPSTLSTKTYVIAESTLLITFSSFTIDYTCTDAVWTYYAYDFTSGTENSLPSFISFSS
jgi:hypothetical protein